MSLISSAYSGVRKLFKDGLRPEEMIARRAQSQGHKMEYSLKQLEPRILLSADGLLNAIIPDQSQDLLQDSMQQVVQYAELLETHEEVEEQVPAIGQLVAQELDPSDTFETNLYEPIVTLFANQDNTDTNKPVDLVSSPGEDSENQTTLAKFVYTNFDAEVTNIFAVPTGDGSMPIDMNDADSSIEYATSIEIRGPPLILSDASIQSGPAGDLLWGYPTGNLISTQNGPIILSEGQVLFLGSGLRPSELHVALPTNIDAADTLNTDQLWSGGGLGLDLTGSGLTVGIWEATEDSSGYYVSNTHQELTGRVSFGDASGTPIFSNHATHVAGTIAASGVNAAAQGMASQIGIRSYSADNFVQEMNSDAGLIAASNHSYSVVTGWSIVDISGLGMVDTWIGDRSISDTESESFGKYDSLTQDLDQVLYDNPNLLSVWSAGNDRTEMTISLTTGETTPT